MGAGRSAVTARDSWIRMDLAAQLYETQNGIFSANNIHSARKGGRARGAGVDGVVGWG